MMTLSLLMVILLWFSCISITTTIAIDERCINNGNDMEQTTCVPSSRIETLGYVTPWNSKGYDYAQIYSEQFTYVSPVWFQIRRSDKVILTGTHDIDMEWIDRIRHRRSSSSTIPTDEHKNVDSQSNAASASATTSTRIVPRIIYEMTSFSLEDQTDTLNVIVKEVLQNNLDGIVFELPVLPLTISFLQRLGKALHQHNKLFVLVIQPTSLVEHLDLLNALAIHVYRFSVNFYDYSAKAGQRNGPNSPIPWIEQTLSNTPQSIKERILMGLPFYGYDQEGQPIVGNDIEPLLKKQQQLIWDDVANEHYYTDDKNKVYIPTKSFVEQRLHLAKTFGVAGVAIWELGQGYNELYQAF